MSNENDNDDLLADRQTDVPRFWRMIPLGLRIGAGVLVGAAALLAAVPRFLDAATGLFGPRYARYVVVRTKPDDFLALRVLPAIESDKILEIPLGSVVECGAPSEDRPAWRRCRFAGRSGYSYYKHLDKLED